MKPDQHTPFGLTLAINKPLEWTSFDVVNKLRYKARDITGQKRIKVGHAGTLDPLASGLVIVCFGKHTKRINELMGLPKQYVGTMQLGATTPSYDLETEINHTFEVPDKDIDLLKNTAKRFQGSIEQLPPKFSAKKIEGKKAYDLARKGKDVKLSLAQVQIDCFEVEVNDYPNVDFMLDCSKGTYVRSLVHDFGKALNSGAHLTKLIRTQIGSYHLSQSLTIEEALNHIERAFHDHRQLH